MSNTNREYKDSVFVKLFNDKDKLIELYNAIEHTNYPNDTEVEIITLDDVLYNVRKNDLGFQIEKRLIIIMEHQSTINPNMPMRMLFYIAREYEKVIDNEAIYKGKLMKIPVPQLIVLYNGKEKFPKETKLRLSDAFIEPPKNFVLDLEIKIININYDPDCEILAASPTLNEYAQFIAKIRSFEETDMSRDEAIKQSIKECIKAGILKEFLKKHGSEVYNMLLTEFNMEDALRVRGEEGREDGEAAGEVKGEAKQEVKTIKNMIKKGFQLHDIVDILGSEVNYVQKSIDLINKYPNSSDIEIATMLIN